MATRRELFSAIRERYRGASRRDKVRILDELEAVAGYHRKHVIRLLGVGGRVSRPRAVKNRLYDAAVRQGLIVLWETSDRLCGKRLKAAIPGLIAAMERHGHFDVESTVKERLLRISAASIDRLLSDARKHADHMRRRRAGVGNAIRRSVPVRCSQCAFKPIP